MILQTLITQYFQWARTPFALRPQRVRRLSTISVPPRKRLRGPGELEEPQELQELHTKYNGDCVRSYDGDNEDYDSDNETVTDDELYNVLSERNEDIESDAAVNDDTTSRETINNGRGTMHSLAPGERIPIHTQRPHPITPLHALVLSNNHRDSVFTTFRNSLELVQVKNMHGGYQTKNCTETAECADWKMTPHIHIGSNLRSTLLIDHRDTLLALGFLLNTKLCNNSTPILDKCQPHRGDLKDKLHVRFPSASDKRRLQTAPFIWRRKLINDLCKMSAAEQWNRGQYVKRLLHLRPKPSRAGRDLERNLYKQRSPLYYFARPMVGKPMSK